MQVQAATIVGAGNFSIPVFVTVTGLSSNSTTDVPTADKRLDQYFATLIPSLVVVLVAVAIFGLLYYRRQVIFILIYMETYTFALSSDIEEGKERKDVRSLSIFQLEHSKHHTCLCSLCADICVSCACVCMYVNAKN